MNSKVLRSKDDKGLFTSRRMTKLSALIGQEPLPGERNILKIWSTQRFNLQLECCNKPTFDTQRRFINIFHISIISKTIHSSPRKTSQDCEVNGSSRGSRGSS